MIDNEIKKKAEKVFKKVVLPLTYASAAIFLVLNTYTEFFHKKVPNTSKVEEGYVVPSKLELDLENLDGAGKKEFVLTYDGTPYLFMLDSAGRPVARDYDIIPARGTEVVPK